MNIKHILYSGLAASLLLAGSGCKKDFLTTNPSTGQTIDQIFANTKSAYKAINGLHSYMTTPVGDDQFGHSSFMLVNDLLGNDMPIGNSGHWFRTQYNYQEHRTANGAMPGYAWGYYYSIINNANLILERIDNVPGVEAERQDIKGQALFYRAFGYMNLIQYYQHTYLGHESDKGIPIYTKGTVAETTPQGRGTVQDVYNLMEADLTEAINLLGLTTVQHSEKSHINVYIAQGLKARLCMLMGKWSEAKSLADDASAGYPLSDSVELVSGFNNNLNSEWMWATSLTDQQISNLFNFIGWMDYESSGYARSYYARVTKELYDLIPAGDARKNWFQLRGTFYNQRKFRTKIPGTNNGDILFMRASEMYLIAAEASARMGNFADAREDLKDLLDKRRNTELDGIADADLLDFIYLQRRIELYGEGFAYFDIQRWKKPLARPTGPQNHDPAMAITTSLDPEACEFLFMIPQREFETNPNMDISSDQNNCL